MEFEKVETFHLKKDHRLDEQWLQRVIAENPEILGLGENLAIVGKERRQPSGGRLDLLLQDSEGNKRYTVEIQLGATDETHIIRTIEYWDVERKRYPQYEHYAVIVAEEITGRFFNVINLFNGHIPLIAIKLTALRRPEGTVGLLFTKTLDALTPGVEDLVEEPPADWDYWISRAGGDTVALTKTIFEQIGLDEKWSLNPTRSYIGVKEGARPNNILTFKPWKRFLLVRPVISQSDDITAKLDAANLDYEYQERSNRYMVRVHNQEEAGKISEILRLLFHTNTQSTNNDDAAN